MDFHVELTFLNKEKRILKYREEYHQADVILRAIRSLSSAESQDLIGVRICYIGRSV